MDIELGKKIWAINQKLPKIKKNTKGFKFKYANLEAIEKALKPLLLEYGIGYGHSLKVVDGKNILVTTIFELESNGKAIHELSIPDAVKLAGMNDYQSLGSALTYFRRYHLVTAFGIITDEDVDAVEAKKEVKINHVGKLKQLIEIGRAKTTLLKYLATYKAKMTTAEFNDCEKLINEMK